MSKSLLILTILLSTLSSSFAADIQCEIESVYHALCDNEHQEAEKQLNDLFSSDKLNIKQLRQAIFFTQANQKSVNDNHALNILFNLQKQLARAFYEAEQLKSATDAYEQAKQTLNTLQQMGKINKPSKQAREKVYYGLVDLLLTRAERTTDYDKRQQLLNQVIETLEVLKQADLQEYFQDDCLISDEGRLDNKLVEDTNNKRLLSNNTLQTAILYPILFPDHLDLPKPRVVELLLIKFKPVPGEPKIKKEIFFKSANNTNITTLDDLNQKIVKHFRNALLHVRKKEWGNTKIKNETDIHRQDVKKYGHELYKILIQPIDSELKKIREHNVLVFVPDGVLRTIPLVALSDKHGKFVVEKNYAVATIPGLTLTKSVTEEVNRHNPKILLGGTSEAAMGFPVLKKTKQALKSIAQLYPWRSTRLKKLTIHHLKNEMRSIQPYTIIHLHTHGKFESCNKEKKKDCDRNNSFLLTDDLIQNENAKRLTMDVLQDIFRIAELRQSPIELLTLSACQTAAGDEQAALGLAGVAFKSGARSVVASLWDALEIMAKDLMERFHCKLQNGGISKVHALQQAQQELLKLDDSGLKCQNEHPKNNLTDECNKPVCNDVEKAKLDRYWAPFILIGSWF